MHCPKHHWYTGMYKHRTECEVCDLIYFDRHNSPEPLVFENKPKKSFWRKILCL